MKISILLIFNFSLLDGAFGTYQSKVLPILQKKCTACHTQTPAKPFFYDLPLLSHWTRPYVNEKLQRALDSFEIFPTIDEADISKYARRIQQTVDGQTMPPSAYLILHPDHRLSEAEREVITDWASSNED